MEWGWIVIYALGILGVAFIAGGIVAYRGSRRTGIRSFAAASIASGAMMWMVVLLVVPASGGSTGPGGPAAGTGGFAVEGLIK